MGQGEKFISRVRENLLVWEDHEMESTQKTYLRKRIRLKRERNINKDRVRENNLHLESGRIMKAGRNMKLLWKKYMWRENGSPGERAKGTSEKMIDFQHFLNYLPPGLQFSTFLTSENRPFWRFFKWISSIFGSRTSSGSSRTQKFLDRFAELKLYK